MADRRTRRRRRNQGRELPVIDRPLDWPRDWPIVVAALFGAAVVGALLVRSSARDAEVEALQAALGAAPPSEFATSPGLAPYGAIRAPLGIVPMPTKSFRARAHGAVARQTR